MLFFIRFSFVFLKSLYRKIISLGLSGVFYLTRKEVWDFVLVIGVGCISGFAGSVRI